MTEYTTVQVAELVAENRKWLQLHIGNKYQREAAKRMTGVLDALEQSLAELRQERERAGEATNHAVLALAGRRNAVADLSRAEETIEKVRTALRRAMSRKEWRDSGWEVPAIEVKCALDAIEYGKQKDQTA